MKPNLLKNVYAAAVALFVALFAMPTTTKAQVAYDLAVAGKKVTSANCNDLSVIEGVRGTVSYDPTANVLTLQNTEIITEGNINAIYSKIDGMTLKVIDINKLKAHKAAITLRNPMTINGGGTLKVESEKTVPSFFFQPTSPSKTVPWRLIAKPTALQESTARRKTSPSRMLRLKQREKKEALSATWQHSR